MKKRRGGNKRKLTLSELARTVVGNWKGGCLSCHKLKMQVSKLEADWAGIVRANIRLALWAKSLNVELPTDFKLKKQFPLKDYD